MKLDLAVIHGCQNRFAIVDEDVTPIADACKGALVLAVAPTGTGSGPGYASLDRRGSARTFVRSCCR